MLGKNDVYSFLNKVERKALKSVQEKYDTELANAIETFLNEPANHAVRDAIKAVEFNYAEGIKATNIVRKSIPSCDRYNNYFTARDIKQDLFGSRYYATGFPTISAVHSEYAEILRKTKEEYAKITNSVKRKKTGEQGKTALIALGFDITWLDNLSNLPVVVSPVELVIDKALIFPCGESGV